MQSSKLSLLELNARIDAAAKLLDGGLINIFSGAMPKDVGSVNGEPLLAQLKFASPAFSPAKDGVAVAKAITSEFNARRDGTASWCALLTASGQIVRLATVGESNSNINLTSVKITKGAQVSINSFILT